MLFCCATTSSLLYLDYCVEINNNDIESGKKFTKKSRVRCDWILRVDKDLIGKHHSVLKMTKMEEIISVIQNLISIS